MDQDQNMVGLKDNGVNVLKGFDVKQWRSIKNVHILNMNDVFLNAG
jgi:hypothetical protein